MLHAHCAGTSHAPTGAERATLVALRHCARGASASLAARRAGVPLNFSLAPHFSRCLAQHCSRQTSCAKGVLRTAVCTALTGTLLTGLCLESVRTDTGAYTCCLRLVILRKGPSKKFCVCCFVRFCVAAVVSVSVRSCGNSTVAECARLLARPRHHKAPSPMEAHTTRRRRRHEQHARVACLSRQCCRSHCDVS